MQKSSRKKIMFVSEKLKEKSYHEEADCKIVFVCICEEVEGLKVQK